MQILMNVKGEQTVSIVFCFLAEKQDTMGENEKSISLRSKPRECATHIEPCQFDNLSALV